MTLQFIMAFLNLFYSIVSTVAVHNCTRIEVIAGWKRNLSCTTRALC